MISTSIILLLMSVCSVRGNMTADTCTEKDISTAYLDAAVDMITKAKYHIPSDYDCTRCPNDCTKCPNDCTVCPSKECPECPKCPKTKPVDCADILNMGRNRSGIYLVWPMNRMTEGKSIPVYCDMDTEGGGWTVIQRRGDFGSPVDYFYREWISYKEGFGKLEKDFWLGNDNIFVLTNEKYYSARFDLVDTEKNRRYARYDNFWIDNEDANYKLHISNYSGDAGDAMAYNNNKVFSAKDRNIGKFNYSGNCAEKYKGAWWYEWCSSANLNGLYHKEKYVGEDGIFWFQWKDLRESLAWTEIKIRPKHFTS